MRGLLTTLALIACFAYLLAGAVDQEFAHAEGGLSERAIYDGRNDDRQGTPAAPRASSYDRNYDRGEPTATASRPPDNAAFRRGASYSRPQLPRLANSESLYQGKPVRWWARRAVQARKDANARGRTIRRLQAAARQRLAYPTGHWLDGAFLCIHRYERGAAGWQTATGNGYRGGLQFDSSFARSYGPSWAFRAFGGVERWPASVQIAAAVQAWTTRGFGPWPTTRRMCGL